MDLTYILNLLISGVILVVAPMAYFFALGLVISAIARIYYGPKTDSSETSVGVSVLTHQAMHADRIAREGEDVTSTYVPIVDTQAIIRECRVPRPLWKRVGARVLAGLLGIAVALATVHLVRSVKSRITYARHVDKICEQTGPNSWGYTQGVWSDHPDLTAFGPEVPSKVRAWRGRIFCGHEEVKGD